MMMILLSLFFFMFNMINKNFIQLFIQNIMFIYIFIVFIKFPLSSDINIMDLYHNLGMDYFSWGLILLSMWIINMMILISVKIFNKFNYYIYYMNIIYLILIFLFMSFYSLNMMWFYIYFESSLIPMFLLILGWGYQINRIQAGLYMMLYTLFGSLPLLMMIFYLYKINFSLSMHIDYKIELNWFFFLFLILGFLIKMPMYFLHLWLPKAHVEAPVMGSMILAGVMLKLGSYGLMRILKMMSLNFMYCKHFILLSLIGGILSSLICLNQVDMKMLVAYSSVVHMSLLLSGMMTMSNNGYYGGYLMMIGHGLCSSGLFYLVNVNYERLMSRSLYINKGMMNYFPSLSLMWFMLISSNLSFPPSLNLFSEIFLVISLINWLENLFLMMIFLMFFSAIYSLYLYSFSQQGKFMKMYFFNNIKLIEFYVILMHWFPLNLMFFIIKFFY